VKYSLLAVPALLLAFVLAACGDDDPVNPPATGVYTVSGKLKCNKATTVPADARVLVAWSVSSGSPDYMYIYGEGTANMADSTFRVTFDSLPPADALNRYGLGVGLVFVTTNKAIAEGKYVGMAADSLFEGAFVGGAPDYAVIYINGSPDSVALGRSWAKKFQTGFNTGKGVRTTGTFEEFEPTPATGIEMIIDELSNLDWVNWT